MSGVRVPTAPLKRNRGCRENCGFLFIVIRVWLQMPFYIKSPMKNTMEQFRLSREREYGKSSEKSGPSQQLNLFNDAEFIADKKPVPPAEEVPITSTRTKGNLAAKRFLQIYPSKRSSIAFQVTSWPVMLLEMFLQRLIQLHRFGLTHL
jgi:hypothetical protein